MDLTQIQTVLGLATSAVGLTGQATATVEAVRKTFSGKTGEAGSEVTQELLNRLATQLLSANMANLQLSNSLKEVAAQIEKEQAFEKRLAKYELFENDYSELVYRLRAEHVQHEPPHYICPICIEKDKQFHFVTGPKYAEGKQCQGCQHYFQFRPTNVRSQRSYSDF